MSCQGVALAPEKLSIVEGMGMAKDGQACQAQGKRGHLRARFTSAPFIGCCRQGIFSTDNSCRLTQRTVGADETASEETAGLPDQ